MDKVSLFHLGPPKTATTWVYHCLREHPQICTSKIDSIHYFDMHYVRGADWYDAQFEGTCGDNVVRFDPTYSYICSPRAIQRIAEYNPEARLIVCLRDPVERAFSHYWHVKKQGGTTMPFADVLRHYNNYATWLEHGFIGIGLKTILDHFPRNQLYVMMYDDLKNNPASVWQKTTQFFGIDSAFTPVALNKKVNSAGMKKTFINKALSKMMGVGNLPGFLSGLDEYKRGIPVDVATDIRDVCLPEIECIETLLDIDLGEWKNTQ